MLFSEKFIKANDEVCDFDNHVPAPYFRKKIKLDFVPEKAEITVCGLGFYELYLNGKEITRCPLAPNINNPDHICYYDKYDITDLLKKGDNVIGVLLGNGMRNAFGGFVWQFNRAKSRGPVIMALAFEANGEGKELSFEADETFKTHSSPVIFNDLRMGYRYDSRLEIPHWNEAEFDDSDWENARKAKAPVGKAELCTAEPVVYTAKLSPVSVKHYDELPFCHEGNAQSSPPMERTIRKNVYIYDFGINSAGVTVLKINGKPGQKITIRHSEYTLNGIPTTNTTLFNIPDAVEYYLEYGQTDVFICKGGEETFIPKFKYDGFRYAYVEGLEPYQATDDAVTYYTMSGDFKERSTFESSDEILNKIFDCARRSDVSNFLWFPTDCPHREKNGWTGDANMSAEHMLLNLTVENSLKNWLAAFRNTQRADGAIPGVIPTDSYGYDWGNGPTWDAAAINIPYYIYKYTGDESVINDNETMMLRYLDYVEKRRDEKGLIAFGLGDWLDPFSYSGGPIASPVEFTDTATIYEIAVRSAYMFGKVGKKYAENYALQFAADLRESIRKNLIDFNTLAVAGDCQTSQALAIALGLFDENEMCGAKKRLVDIIHRDNDVNHCGMIGLRYIFHVLSEMGETDLAYKMIVDTGRTGYGYFISHGATTLWESFHDVEIAADSRNHHFFGDVSSWMIQRVAGIVPNPDVDDIRRVDIVPHFVNGLSFAKAKFESVCGTVEVKWERKEDSVVLEITVPDGIHGKIVLPDGWSAELPKQSASGKYIFTRA